MAQSINTFIKSKLNKDLDARLMQNGEYRDATNVQVSKSEGPNVGSLENVLGNESVLDMEVLTGEDTKWACIGQLPSEVNDSVYMFWTDYTDPDPLKLVYSTTAKNAIIKYNALTGTGKVLVQGAFLNFSRTHPIYGINLLEELLFWTDNRNQPRVINVQTAEDVGTSYYTIEDQISVAKYNPYEPIYFWQESAGSSATIPYETTMQDVTSKYYPNGGSAQCKGAHGGGSAAVTVDNVKGDILQAGAGVENPYSALGAAISYIHPSTGVMTSTGETVSTYVPTTGVVTATGVIDALDDNTELIFNPNTYYDKSFAGDEDYLDDKFVRFSYRFKFEDGQYSIMAPFTQQAFIPKQDGYFMYVNHDTTGDYPIPQKDDQTDTYRSTIVSFMENKVDEIKLRIPLPFAGNSLNSSLKVTEMDILYKESDGLSVKVIDTIPVADIATAAAATSIYDYTYLSKKPFKTLPSDEIIRVYDKVPVKALSQEISGNRVIYGNFQNKHTPLDSINYNVAVGAKSSFDLQTGTATVDGAQDIAANADFDIDDWTPFEAGNGIVVGDIITITSSGALVGTVTAVVTPGASANVIKVNAAIDLADAVALTFSPAGPDSQTVSRIEYPNSSVKQNRNYQVGVVLADRYGRQSSVILSNNDDVSSSGGSSFVGDTIYSSYNSSSVVQNDWPGDAIKVLFNDPLSPSNPNQVTKWPGLYNGDITSANYNPLGWYSYKIVVKQTEQEYYNVYLPGIMASYPEDQTLELGGTSFVTLINDNINKVPRDLTELGPAQKQFRSSVQLFGRVENTNTVVTYGAGANATKPQNIGDTNTPYFPGRSSDTVSTVSTLDDLFNYNPATQPRPNYYPQFYGVKSNPLIAKISTDTQIGQVATTNYGISSGLLNVAVTSASNLVLKNVIGTPTAGSFVTGEGVPEGVFVGGWTPGTSTLAIVDSSNVAYNITLPIDTVLYLWPGFVNPNLGNLKRPGLQYLAVYETEPVESLLDIFWETSTAGLISELNSLIINSAEGAAGLSSFNTSPWDEETGGNTFSAEDILSGDFTLIDGFGVDIDDADITSVTLTSVVDQNGVDRQLPANGGPYFTLVDDGSKNYNVQVTNAYWNNIFYSNNDAVRTFSFTFNTTTTVGGNVSNNSFIETAGPDNESPKRGTDITPSAGAETPASGDNVYTNRTITTVQGTCDFVNGAANSALRWQDLTLSLGVTKDGVDVTSNNYFSLTTTQTGTVQRGTVAIVDSSMPIDEYVVTITGTDAEISSPATYVLNIDLTTSVSYAEQVFRCAEGDYSCAGYTVMVMAVSTSGIAANKGWYGYIGSLTSNTNLQGGPLVDSGNITIDKTNAYTSAQSNGDYRNDWFFFQQATPNQTGLNTLLGYIASSTDDFNFSGLDNATGETWCYLYGTGSSGGSCGCTYQSCDTPYVLDVTGYAIETV